MPERQSHWCVTASPRIDLFLVRLHDIINPLLTINPVRQRMKVTEIPIYPKVSTTQNGPSYPQKISEERIADAASRVVNPQDPLASLEVTAGIPAMLLKYG